MGAPIHRFRVGFDDGAGRMYFEVRIFADEPAMREHYRRSSSLAGRKVDGEAGDGWLADTAAMCCPRSTADVDADGGLLWQPIIGYILLPLGHVNTRVVTHELVHAALAYYRERRWRTGHPSAANFGGQCSEREEALGHIYCGLVVEMSNKLHDRGLWGREAA